MLVHGDIDNNVHPANTTRVVNALIRAGKRFDMLYLPGQRHGFGDMNEYFYWRLVDYFSEHLKGQERSEGNFGRYTEEIMIPPEKTNQAVRLGQPDSFLGASKYFIS